VRLLRALEEQVQKQKAGDGVDGEEERSNIPAAADEPVGQGGGQGAAPGAGLDARISGGIGAGISSMNSTGNSIGGVQVYVCAVCWLCEGV